MYLITQLCKMIHNTYFEIIAQFLGDYTREIYGRQLIGKVSLSQKAIALTLEKLESEGVLVSRKSGNMRFYALNKKNPQIKDIITITELTRKTEFLNKHKIIAQVFKGDSRIIGVFGSYAKNIEKKDSDVDIFIIGEKNSTDNYVESAQMFDLDVSIKYFSLKEFKKLRNNPLVKEIIAHHVILSNAEGFVSIVGKDFYGFD